MLIGDFNCILDQQEKLGGTSSSSLSNTPLRRFIQAGGFFEVKPAGSGYTWTNKQKTSIHDP